VADVRPVASPPVRSEVREEPVEEVVTERFERGTVEVPDVTGRVGREAIATLLSISLEPRLSGTGRVVSQSPVAGARVEKGTRVVLELAARQ
jgi:cell division protein FtsI (penicillin-binding protein 3)